MITMTLAKTALLDASDCGQEKGVRAWRPVHATTAVVHCMFHSLTLGFLTSSSRSLTCCLSRFWHFHISFKALRASKEEFSPDSHRSTNVSRFVSKTWKTYLTAFVSRVAYR